MCSNSFMNIPFNQLGKAGYNRGINRQHVNKIKNDFHEDMVQPAIVSFRDGKYWIIDHQHQTQAIYELNGNNPNILIRCDVRTGLTYEQEAELYYRLNTGSKHLSFSDLLKGQIEAKDTTALKYRDTVESCGYVIGGGTSNSLNALSLTYKIFNKPDGDKKLVQILALCKACWPNDKSGIDSRMIDGINLFLENHQNEYSRDRFVKMLSAQPPEEIIRKSVAYYKQINLRNFTQPYCTYMILITEYNNRLKNKLTPVQPKI